MPQLKQLSCCIQWSDTGAPFLEHGTVYGDGVVETFIIVPNKPQGFSIRLTSRGYISAGLVMVVFIDGNYQCNRSRVNLLPPSNGQPANRTEIDFLLRQKEKPQGDGIYLGREWRFDSHNIVNEPPPGFQESHFEDLGVIEVLVLRCRAKTREEADYEGSSSGEDSDIFEERPHTQEKESASILPEPSYTAPTATDAPAVTIPGQAEEEDDGGGFIGLFDGANDIPNPLGTDGGSHGRWIWHQSHAPFFGLHDPRQHFQPRSIESYPPNHAQTAASAGNRPEYDRRGFAGHASRRVHFDDSALDTRRDYLQHPQRPPPPHDFPRPPSRTRERRSSGSHEYLAYSNGQQHNPDFTTRPTRYEPQQHQFQQQSSSSKYHDDPQPTWGRGRRHIQGDDNRASYSPLLARHEAPHPPQDRTTNSNQDNGQKRPSPTDFNCKDTAPGQHPNASLHDPQQSLPLRTRASNNEAATPLHVQTPRQESRTPQSNSRTPARHVNPQGRSNGSDKHAAGDWYRPLPYNNPCPYPYPVHVPYVHHYGGGLPPGYWQPYFSAQYGPGNVYGPSGRQAAFSLHPPHNLHPGMDQQVGPTDPAVAWQDQGHGIGIVPGSWPVQGGPLEQGEAKLDDSNDNANEGWKDNDNSANNTSGWDTDNKGGEDANNNQDQGNNDGGDQGNDWNADSGNQNNDDWGNDNANNINNDSGWDNNDNNNVNDNNGWDTQADTTDAANNNTWDQPAAGNIPSGAQHAAFGSAEVDTTIDTPRDLYGPHGPYYALRADRFSETRPDAEEEPRFDVPRPLAIERGSTKQVQPGPGYRYYKKSALPEYIDTMDHPYARFVFKYRTKDQLLNETGIEVDTEPSGDSEIQDLQTLDKQALIDMLMRAKGALGGKIPSPPSTPSGSARGSETGIPVIIDAPKQTYLKYSLPPLRPNNVNTGRSGPVKEQPEPQNADGCASKGDNAGWDAGNDWDNGNGNVKANGNDWGGAWDGGEVKDPMLATGRQGSQGQKAPGPDTTQQATQAKGTGKPLQSTGIEWVKETGIPPRPPTPTGVAPQKDTAESNWDEAGDQSAWNANDQPNDNVGW